MNDEDNGQTLVHTNDQIDFESHNISIKKTKNLIEFTTQTVLIYIVCVTAILNLSLGTGCKPLWISFLSSSLGYLLPAPQIKNNETIDNNQISGNPRFSTLKKTRNVIVFTTQIILIYIVVVTAIINLIIGATCKPVWVWLLSSCLGYLLPSPQLKNNPI